MNSKSIVKRYNKKSKKIYMIRAFMLQHQPCEIILRIIEFLDPVSFCKFRQVCVTFYQISFMSIELKNAPFESLYAIEERRYQAYLRERKRGFFITRDGPVSVKQCDKEGMPFGYYSDDYDDLE